MGEVRQLGRVRPHATELCAIYFGLKMAWRMNYKEVELESDWLEIVDLILGSSTTNAKDQGIV